MIGVLVFPRASAALVRAHAPEGARVIAVDGGAQACLDAGVTPAVIVGDMDSARPETLAVLEARGARIERHPRTKRDTDAALALAHLRDCDEIVFLGAGGGRPDHAFATMHLLAQAALWARVRAIDPEARTWVVTPEHPLVLDLPRESLLSAIPFDPTVEGITYEGLAYPLQDAVMRAGDPYGLSNVVSAPEQRIRVQKGRLFVFHPH